MTSVVISFSFAYLYSSTIWTQTLLILVIWQCITIWGEFCNNLLLIGLDSVAFFAQVVYLFVAIFREIRRKGIILIVFLSKIVRIENKV